jgi:hypothetical protein
LIVNSSAIGELTEKGYPAVLLPAHARETEDSYGEEVTLADNFLQKQQKQRESLIRSGILG